MKTSFDYKPLLWTYAALLLLLALTVGSAFFDLGIFNPVINIGVAVAKAALILAVFMSLREDGPLARVFALGGLLWVTVLIGLTLVDFYSRT